MNQELLDYAAQVRLLLQADEDLKAAVVKYRKSPYSGTQAPMVEAEERKNLIQRKVKKMTTEILKKK